MGKKGRKTRWRKLPLSIGNGRTGSGGGGSAANGEGSDGSSAAATAVCSTTSANSGGGIICNGGNNGGPYYNEDKGERDDVKTNNTSSTTSYHYYHHHTSNKHHHHHHHNNNHHQQQSSANSSSNPVKSTFNEDEYTKITTPRQDMLFKKGYLGKKKTVPVTPPQDSLETQSADSIESDQYTCEEQVHPQYMYSGTGYMDHTGVYYINNSYEVYDPYTGNVTVIVGPGYPTGPHTGVLTAVPCQPVPLQPLEWFNPSMPQPHQAYSVPMYSSSRKKRNSIDSQNYSGQSSETTCPPGSPQEPTDGPEPPVCTPQYVYPGYMFGAPLYNMNGVTVQGVVPQTAPLPPQADQAKRRKKRRRKRRGGVTDEGSESSCEDILSCDASVVAEIHSGASSDTAPGSSSSKTNSDSGIHTDPTVLTSGANSPRLPVDEPFFQSPENIVTANEQKNEVQHQEKEEKVTPTISPTSSSTCTKKEYEGETAVVAIGVCDDNGLTAQQIRQPQEEKPVKMPAALLDNEKEEISDVDKVDVNSSVENFPETNNETNTGFADVMIVDEFTASQPSVKEDNVPIISNCNNNIVLDAAEEDLVEINKENLENEKEVENLEELKEEVKEDMLVEKELIVEEAEQQQVVHIEQDVEAIEKEGTTNTVVITNEEDKVEVDLDVAVETSETGSSQEEVELEKIEDEQKAKVIAVSSVDTKVTNDCELDVLTTKMYNTSLQTIPEGNYERPITEAVTKWLRSQGESAIKIPSGSNNNHQQQHHHQRYRRRGSRSSPPPSPTSDSDDEGIEEGEDALVPKTLSDIGGGLNADVTATTNETGQKNGQGNPFPASYPSSDNGTRVAIDYLQEILEEHEQQQQQEWALKFSQMCDPKRSVQKYYSLGTTTLAAHTGSSDYYTAGNTGSGGTPPAAVLLKTAMHLGGHPGPFPCGICCILQ